MTNTANALFGNEKLDQALPIDPADDALHRIEAEGSGIPDNPLKNAFYTDITTIRDALADRITPAAAEKLCDWLGNATIPTPLDPDERELLDFLYRIADRASTDRIGRITNRDEEAGN
jgi:hypothetical protein